MAFKDLIPPTSGASSDQLYLSRLTFDPKLRESWLNFFVSNFRVVILMIILILLWGVYSFNALPRESNPEVKIPVGMIMTSYPGASPADVEELITKKIEKEVANLKGVDTVTSTSANSMSSISVNFLASEDLEDAIRRLRDAVENVKSELPDDGDEPIVKEVSFDDQPMWTVALTGPFDGQTLRKYAENVQEELEKIDGVREVNISGGEQVEMEVAYDPAKLAEFGLSPDVVNQTIRTSNVVFPAGSFEVEKFNYTVRSDARFFDAKALGNVPVLHAENNAIVYLKDVAMVREKSIKRTSYARLSVQGGKPQEAVSIDILKKTGGSVINVAAESKKTIEAMIEKMPKGVQYTSVIDFSKEIATNFTQLTHDFLITIFLVGMVLFLVVGLKEAFVAGLAVPLVFCVSFGVMLLTGISLNFLSLFSLILSLGLLVDDAIVVVSATKQYLRSGKFTPEEAVLLVLRDFKVVLTTTTLTTVWAFLPLLMASGMIGQFIKSIPITASVTLTSSLFIALMINHPLAAVLERIRLTPGFFFSLLSVLGFISFLFVSSASVLMKIIGMAGIFLLGFLLFQYRKRWKFSFQKNALLVEKEWEDDELIKEKLRQQGNEEHASFSQRLMHGILNFHKVLPLYEKWLRWSIETRKNRWKIIGGIIGLFIFAVALPITGVVKSEFFPASDEEYLFVNLEGPVGLKLQETDKIIQKVENALLVHPEIKSFSTVVGGGTSGGQLGGGGSGSHLASITVNLFEAKERDVTSVELAEKIRKQIAGVQGARITVQSAQGGPPSGSAFEARIIGEDLTVLDKIAHDLLPLLKSVPGVVDADISLKPSPADYTFSLNRAKMELLNVNPSYVGSILRTAVSGSEVTKILRDGDEIKVIARFDEKKVPTLAELQNLQILNMKKEPIFIKDVANIQLTPSVEAIKHIDQKRVILLSSAAAPGALPTEMLKAFQKKLATEYTIPAGYSIEYGGENEENAESVGSILMAMRIALLLIIATLVIQFNSFVKPFIVLMTIPFALIGVFFGLAILQLPLSFPGLIGIVALFGIVVKNAIILVDKINLNIDSGIPFMEAIVDAGKSRLEAIVITSICTIFGILPVTLSNAVWTALGSAIIFGLMLSSFLTLFVVPTLFVMMVKPEKVKSVL